MCDGPGPHIPQKDYVMDSVWIHEVIKVHMYARLYKYVDKWVLLYMYGCINMNTFWNNKWEYEIIFRNNYMYMHTKEIEWVHITI